MSIYENIKLGIDGIGSAIILFPLSVLLAISMTGCKEKSSSNNEAFPQNYIWCFYDRCKSDAWDETNEQDLPRNMPDSKFKWTDSDFTKIKDNYKTSILDRSRQIWNLFITDLNGDGKPEFCMSRSVGSGICDDNVEIFDYSNNKKYSVWDRTVYDYRLSIQDEKLIITRTNYPHSSDDEGLTGSISIEKNKLIIKYTNGQTKKNRCQYSRRD